MFFVYILKSTYDGMFYVGHTEDLRQRMREHSEGRSRFTRTRGPWELVFAEVVSSRSEAMKREKEIRRRVKVIPKVFLKIARIFPSAFHSLLFLGRKNSSVISGFLILHSPVPGPSA